MTTALTELIARYERLRKQASALEKAGCYPRKVMVVNRMAGIASALAVTMNTHQVRSVWAGEAGTYEGHGAALVGKPCLRQCVFCTDSPPPPAELLPAPSVDF